MSKFFCAMLRKIGMVNKFYHILNNIYAPFYPMHPYNLVSLVKSFKRLKEQEIIGDYYEFGVGSGFSLWFSYYLSIEYCLENISFWGFDSFEGFPNPTGIDKKVSMTGAYFTKGSFAFSLNLVKKNLRKYNCDMNRIHLIKGYYNKILNDDFLKEYNLKKASIILIDCDMYQSTLEVLNFIPKILSKKTIVLFDDFYLTDNTSGQQLAIKQWQKNKKIKLKEFCEYGLLKGFIVSYDM